MAVMKMKRVPREIEFYLMILRKHKTDHVNNVEIKTKRIITHRIRKMNLEGHILRKERMDNLTATSHISRKRDSGQQRVIYRKSLCKWTG